jgi:hypothetical protein
VSWQSHVFVVHVMHFVMHFWGIQALMTAIAKELQRLRGRLVGPPGLEPGTRPL